MFVCRCVGRYNGEALMAMTSQRADWIAKEAKDFSERRYVDERSNIKRVKQ